MNYCEHLTAWSELHDLKKKTNTQTCVTIETIEQQKPPKNAVTHIVSTDLANTVKIQDNENGNDIIVNSRRRPYCKNDPPNIAPNKAPVFVL